MSIETFPFAFDTPGIYDGTCVCYTLQPGEGLLGFKVRNPAHWTTDIPPDVGVDVVLGTGSDLQAYDGPDVVGSIDEVQATGLSTPAGGGNVWLEQAAYNDTDEPIDLILGLVTDMGGTTSATSGTAKLLLYIQSA